DGANAVRRPVAKGGSSTAFPATPVFWIFRVPLLLRIPPPPKWTLFSRIVLLVMESWPPIFATPPPLPFPITSFFAMVLLTISATPELPMPPPDPVPIELLKITSCFSRPVRHGSKCLRDRRICYGQ